MFAPLVLPFLITVAAKHEPLNGYGVLVILPGGDGSDAFHPFVKRIRQHAVPDEFLVLQPVAFKWSSEQQIVWPAEKLKVEKQEFSTESFVESVIEDASKRYKIDSNRVLCMGWSSSGSAVYSLALRERPVVTGSYVLMSVYKSQYLPMH